MRPSIEPTPPAHSVAPERSEAPAPGSVMRPRRRARSLLAIGLEIVLAVGSCLLFYAVFLAVLGAIFPQGTGLRDLIGRAGESGLSRTALSASPGARDSMKAVLRVLKRNVLHKPADKIAWSAASDGVVLAGGDGVQTSSRGEAEVAFDSENQVRLGRNTLIVIKQPSDRDAPRRRSTVAVVAGELWAQLSPNAEHEMDLHIEAGGARAQVRSGSTKTGESGFKVTVAPDRVPTFAIYGGTADIEAHGKMVRLSGNQFITVDSTGPSTPRGLLPPPQLVAPEDSAGIPRSQSAVTFSWRAVEGAERYQLLVARDPGFEQRVFDRRTEGIAVTSGPLVPGEYSWRVVGGRDAMDGVPSATRRFKVERSAEGPVLRVVFPSAVVRAPQYRLTGTTDPGATVLAAGKRVVADARGHFTCQVPLKRGVSVLVVEAIDAEGRSSYASAVVNAKF